MKQLLGTSLIALAVLGCSSQSTGTTDSAAGTAAGATTAVGNAQNVVGETKTAASRTVPDYDSFTLGFSALNPNAWDTNGTTVAVTVRVADNLNDKTVLDGLDVYFSTEGGAIGETCQITNGLCTVNWTSQDPRPANGRATVVAWMSGSESFKDLNSSGFFDDGDLFDDAELDGHGSKLRPDLSEPYRNDNMGTRTDVNKPYITGNITSNTVYDAASEKFFDAPGLTGNTFDGPDGKYSGAECAHATLCATLQTLFIWKDTEIVMSDNNPVVGFFSDAALTTPVAQPLDVSGGSQTVYITVADRNGNSLPFNTTVKSSTKDVKSGSDIDSQLGSGTHANVYILTLEKDTTPSTGSLEVEVVVPAEASAGVGETKDTATLRTQD